MTWEQLESLDIVTTKITVDVRVLAVGKTLTLCHVCDARFPFGGLLYLPTDEVYPIDRSLEVGG